MSVRIEGLEQALAAMRKAFPKDPEQQRRLLNQTMSAAAKATIIPIAKDLAYRGDSSGALSESIAPRAVSRSRALSKGMAASVEVTPVRGNRKALAMYIQHYYNQRGKAAPTNIATSGIRHGHLIEFGTVRTAANPFLGPAAEAGFSPYRSVFSKIMRSKTESAVRRAARKKVLKKS